MSSLFSFLHVKWMTVGLLALALPQAGYAQISTDWFGGTDSNWSNGGNWTGSTPGPADTATLSGIGGGNQPTLTTNSSAATVNMNGSGNTLNLQTFSLTANMFNLSAGTISGTGSLSLGNLSMTGGTIAGTVDISISNSFSINRAGDFDLSSVVSGAGSLTKDGAGRMTLGGNATYTGGSTINGGTIRLGGGSLPTTTALTVNTGGAFDLNGFNPSVASLSGSGGTINLGAGGGGLEVGDATSTTYAGSIVGGGDVTKNGTGTLTLSGSNTYTGGTTINAGNLELGANNALATTGAVTIAGGNFALNSFNQTVGTLSATGGAITLGSGTLTAGDATSTTVASPISGTGAFVKQGSGTMTFTAANSYNGGTTVNAGILRLGVGGALAASGALNVNAGGTFDLSGTSQTVGAFSGAGNVLLGAGTLTAGNATDQTFSGIISGTGSFNKRGASKFTMTGANTFTGLTTVGSGTLSLSGSLTGPTTVNAGATIMGAGTAGGGLTVNGTIAPGNSIGTLNVNGSFVQNGGIYQVEVDAAGQSDRINVTGAPGTATINGGTVQVLAQPGSYGRNTTSTILNATGGRTGTYSTVTSNFAFLTPTLSYDSNNVFLTLLLSNTAFASGAQTPNQVAVGTALDLVNPTATGDFNTVLNALFSLNTAQGPAALDAISGQDYSGFATASVQGGLLFMNVVGQQMSLARGGGGGGSRVALAQVCDVACDGDTVSRFSVWGSALGGTGSVAGNGNSSTLTYNLGGIATGIDYRFDPLFLVGLSLGYSSGNQWLDGFDGRGTSDSYNAALYASFTPGAFYIDALAGYGYNDNQLTRMIVIPGLAARTAMGRTGANQFTGQAEAGYRFDVYAPAIVSVTPFARFQTISVNQAAFAETGANSLNLSVAQQTTTSVRTVLGGKVSGSIEMGWRDKLALQFRLGWSHEYADVSRPVTASFAGAPGIGYTVYGARPQRDGAVIGFAADTAIAQNTSIYLRYDGEFATGTDNHVLSAGLRMSW